MGNKRFMDRQSMDPIAEKTTITKAKIPKEIQGRKRIQGQGAWKVLRRSTQFWTTCIAFTQFIKLPMDGSQWAGEMAMLQLG